MSRAGRKPQANQAGADFDLPPVQTSPPLKIKLPALEDSLDMRSKVGQALKANEDDMISDLGGRAGLSTFTLGIIKQAALTLALLESGWAWLLGQEAVFGRSDVLPFLAELRHLQAAYLRLGKQAGFSRKLAARGQEAGPASIKEWRAKKSGRAVRDEEGD